MSADPPGRDRHPACFLEPVGKGDHLGGGGVQADVSRIARATISRASFLIS